MTDTHTTPNCNMHEALISYLYDEATPEEASRVKAHLAECAACRSEMESFERVRNLLQQWQLDDMPLVRIAPQEAPPRRALDLIREFFMIAPLWAKAFAAATAVLLVLAVMGTEISIGRNGFSLRANLLRRSAPATAAISAEQPLSPDEVKALVSKMILESEHQHRNEVKAQLMSLEATLENMHSADLAKLAARIQEQRARLNALERDLDRREGLGLADILLGEASDSAKPRAEGGQ
jgi:anti-sigma factor RsiW